MEAAAEAETAEAAADEAEVLVEVAAGTAAEEVRRDERSDAMSVALR